MYCYGTIYVRCSSVNLIEKEGGPEINMKYNVKNEGVTFKKIYLEIFRGFGYF